MSVDMVGWWKALPPLYRHHAPNLQRSRAATVGCCT